MRAAGWPEGEGSGGVLRPAPRRGCAPPRGRGAPAGGGAGRGGGGGSLSPRVPALWRRLRLALWLSLFLPGVAASLDGERGVQGGGKGVDGGRGRGVVCQGSVPASSTGGRLAGLEGGGGGWGAGVFPLAV